VFGLGFWEMVVIAVVALLFLGPDKLPNFFRALGRATREFQRASHELRQNLSIDEPPPPPKPPIGRPPVDVPAAPAGAPAPPARKDPPQPWPTAEDAERRARAAAAPTLATPPATDATTGRAAEPGDKGRGGGKDG